MDGSLVPEFAGAPMPSSADNVRQQQCQPAIVVQPVNIDCRTVAFLRELSELVDNVLGQLSTTRSRVERHTFHRTFVRFAQIIRQLSTYQNSSINVVFIWKLAVNL